MSNWQTAEELIEAHVDELPKLWDPFLIKSGIVALSGSSDCGKSTFLRQLSLAIVNQRGLFLNQRLHVEHGVVYYVATEDGADVIASSLRKQIKQGYGGGLKNLVFLNETANVPDELRKRLRQRRADLIILDAWADTMDGNPNNMIDVRKNMTGYQDLVNEFGCLIIFLHHNIKNSEKQGPDKNKLSGSQAIEAKARAVFELRKGDEPHERIFSVLKANYMSGQEKEAAMVLDFNEEFLVFEPTNKRIDISTVTSGSKIKFERAVWEPRMAELRELGFSFNAAHEKLVNVYQSEKVPGLTWFKNIMTSAVPPVRVQEGDIITNTKNSQSQEFLGKSTDDQNESNGN